MSSPSPQISPDSSQPTLTAFHFIHKLVVTEKDQGLRFSCSSFLCLSTGNKEQYYINLNVTTGNSVTFDVRLVLNTSRFVPWAAWDREQEVNIQEQTQVAESGKPECEPCLCYLWAAGTWANHFISVTLPSSFINVGRCLSHRMKYRAGQKQASVASTQNTVYSCIIIY